MGALRLTLVLACCGETGCQGKRAVPVQASSPATASSLAPRVAAAADSTRLPEDPIAGARSEAQWREHLADEERERKALFDRRHRVDHEAVLAFLRDSRARYDRAQTPAAVLGLKREFPSTSAAIRRRIEQIDRWQNSSNVLADYATLLQLLSEPYPQARLRALSGDKDELAKVQREIDERTKKISDWLAYAAQAEVD